MSDPAECLIRRARRTGRQRLVRDQVTGQMRLPGAAFEPRLPETRPGALRQDKYLSVNILSSLTAAGLPRDWRGNDENFYSVQLVAAVCHDLALKITWEPETGHSNPADDNPHHGGINGIVELYYSDRDAYDRAITHLAKAAQILPECLSRS